MHAELARLYAVSAALVLSLGTTGCDRPAFVQSGGALPGVRSSTPGDVRLRLATSTSVRDSGLLDQLLPGFEQARGCRVDVIAVGTGAALRLGAAGDADVVLVHAPEAEREFVEAGHGARREEFMFNYFVILGPPDDPAQIRDEEPAVALSKISLGGHRFLSRGDESGTHQRELALWKQSGGLSPWNDYIETGRGMGATLIMADEMHAYMLVDRGTYLKFEDRIDLIPLSAPSESLRNPYGVIVVNPITHGMIHAPLAEALVSFLISAEAQRKIAEYEISGQRLFHPTRLANEWN